MSDYTGLEVLIAPRAQGRLSVEERHKLKDVILSAVHEAIPHSEVEEDVVIERHPPTRKIRSPRGHAGFPAMAIGITVRKHLAAPVRAFLFQWLKEKGLGPDKAWVRYQKSGPYPYAMLDGKKEWDHFVENGHGS